MTAPISDSFLPTPSPNGGSRGNGAFGEIGTQWLDVAKKARADYRRVFEGPADDVVRLPEGAATELINALSLGVRRKVQQIVPFSSYGPTDDFAHRVWRTVAADDQRHVAVERLYVIPPGGDPQGTIAAQIAEDAKSQAQSRYVDLTLTGARSPWTLADDDPLSELWLIDDCAVVRKVLSDHAPPVWVVSVREQDVKRAQSLWDLLASRVDAVRSPGVPNLVEPLLESAKMIHTMAPMSCTSSHVDRISCSWYHGVWQYLRLLDMVSSPTWHSEFYQHWLTDSLCDRATKRVLITGTADYSVLAYVIAAATSIGRLNNIETHVLDLCPTPLAECRWYAERARTSVRLHEADILDEADGLVARVAGDERFDLIVTDAFLTRFSRDEVGRVLDNWHALLRPGGRVITTVRLHPLEAHQPSGRPQDLLLYALRLRERAIGFRGMLSIDLDALVKAASEYIERMTSTDLGDVREIATLLQQHGFDPGDPDKIETEKVHGEIVRSTYGRLVLTRT